MTAKDKVFSCLLVIGSLAFMALGATEAGSEAAVALFVLAIAGFLPAYVMAAFAFDEYPYKENASMIRQMIVVAVVILSLFVLVSQKIGLPWNQEGRSVIEQGSIRSDLELQEEVRNAAASEYSFDDRFDAEVWLTDMSRRFERQVRDPKERIEILTLVYMEAERVNLAPELILAVIETESNFDRYAVSVEGELGLMQIRPFWLNEIGRPDDNLLHTDTNLRYGCTILKYYLDQENGNLRRALGRYDGTPGQMEYSNKVIDKLASTWFRR